MTTDSSRISLIALASAALALSACQQRAAETPAAETETAATEDAVPTQEEATAIVDKTEAVWNSGDTALIMALYKEGAVMFDPVVPAPSDDRVTQTKWTDVFTAMKLTGLKVPDRRVQVLDADTIVASGTASFESAAPEGPNSVQFRYSDVYQKQDDGSWMIVHEHLSNVPPPEAG